MKRRSSRTTPRPQTNVTVDRIIALYRLTLDPTIGDPVGTLPQAVPSAGRQLEGSQPAAQQRSTSTHVEQPTTAHQQHELHSFSEMPCPAADHAATPTWSRCCTSSSCFKNSRRICSFFLSYSCLAPPNFYFWLSHAPPALGRGGEVGREKGICPPGGNAFLLGGCFFHTSTRDQLTTYFAHSVFDSHPRP